MSMTLWPSSRQGDGWPATMEQCNVALCFAGRNYCLRDTHQCSHACSYSQLLLRILVHIKMHAWWMESIKISGHYLLYVRLHGAHNVSNNSFPRGPMQLQFRIVWDPPHLTPQSSQCGASTDKATRSCPHAILMRYEYPRSPTKSQTSPRCTSACIWPCPIWTLQARPDRMEPSWVRWRPWKALYFAFSALLPPFVLVYGHLLRVTCEKGLKSSSDEPSMSPRHNHLLLFRDAFVAPPLLAHAVVAPVVGPPST